MVHQRCYGLKFTLGKGTSRQYFKMAELKSQYQTLTGWDAHRFISIEYVSRFSSRYQQSFYYEFWENKLTELLILMLKIKVSFWSFILVIWLKWTQLCFGPRYWIFSIPGLGIWPLIWIICENRVKQDWNVWTFT